MAAASESAPRGREPRGVGAVFVALAVLDLVLAVWAFALPDLWFRVFHGVERVDPQHLLQRMGANWTAFFLVELVATLRWRRERFWILVVAGVRLSDIFTDVTYVLLCERATWFAWASLPLSSAMNFILGVWLVRAWRALPEAAPACPK